MKAIRNYLIIMIISCPLISFAQINLNQASNTLDDMADLAELITLCADITESTSYTLSEIKVCKQNLDEINTLLKNPHAKKFLSTTSQRAWAAKIKDKAATVEMYDKMLLTVVRMLKGIKTDLVKQQSTDEKLGMAIKEGIANAMKVVKEIPVYGQIADGVAGVFGAGSKDADYIPIENAVKGLGSQTRKKTLEEQLIEFLVKINQFNESISRLARDSEMIKRNLGSTLAYNMMLSMPNHSIQQYTERKRLKIE